MVVGKSSNNINDIFTISMYKYWKVIPSPYHRTEISFGANVFYFRCCFTCTSVPLKHNTTSLRIINGSLHLKILMTSSYFKMSFVEILLHNNLTNVSA